MSLRRSASPPRCARWLVLAWLLVVGNLPMAGPSLAQSDLSDVFGDLGTSKVVLEGDDEGIADAMRPGEGALAGSVFDGEAGTPVQGASVILVFPAPADGSAPRQEVEITDIDGQYAFPSVPPGRYSITFVKSGFRTSAMTDIGVEPGVVRQADFPMPRLPTTEGGDVLQLDAFVVEAAAVGEMMTALELRMDSDAMLDVMSAEDFSKYASSDVADALTRVAGVNVVGGQFAVIRGLEDRYSNTTFNGAAVPSPDPERQSVQLDLFPTRVVSNLEVSKTFLPESPGNSAAGAMNIVTTRYPEEFDLRLDAAIRINELPLDGFNRLVDQNPIGEPVSGTDALGGDFGGALGGTKEFGKRAFRYNIVGAWKSDNAQQNGYQESREPLQGSIFPNLPQFNSTGDLALGILSLSDGRYTYERSDQEAQWSVFGGFGVDLDEQGDHTLDLSIFYIDKQDEFVESWTDGYFPGFDYGPLIAAGGEFDPGFYRNVSTDGSWLNNENRTDESLGQNRGPLWFSNFDQGRSIARDRTLLITQLNGEHEVVALEGLHVGWAANYARTTQQDSAYGAQYWYEPCGWSTTFACPAGTSRIPIPTVFPVTAQALGYGSYFAGGQTADFLFSELDVQEQQGFGRLDVEYERELSSRVVSTFTLGGWYEHATRNVDSQFFGGGIGIRSIPVASAVPIDALGLGASIFQPGGVIGLNGQFPDLAVAQVDQTRQIGAFYFGDKLTVLEDWDFLAGLRLESVSLDTQGAPFRRGIAELDGTTQLFPSKYLFLDRVDRPRVPGDQGDQLSGPVGAGTVFNDQILNVPVRPDFSTTLCDAPAPAAPRGCVDLRTDAQIEDALTNDISELAVLPAAGINYRPFDWWTIRTAYSQTLARPSFRELGYYASIEAGQTEVTVGNPYLDVSPVQSVDGRFEFTWGEVGDLAAISGFYKTIENPIEATLVSSPVGRPEIARTFFNNPNTASLWGIELELRKTIDFLGWEFLEYFSVGGNGTYIDAEVARTDVELSRYANFFAVNPRDASRATFSGIAPTRRLFGQPEWIANADLTFNHPGWGSRATLAYYAISDVLESVGAIRTAASGTLIRSLTLDRYIASFYTLDLILGQDLGHGVSLSFRAQNLTDSTRGRLYDPVQTAAPIYERQFMVGRSYKITLSYEF
jgi:TonB-dependent receptor